MKQLTTFLPLGSGGARVTAEASLAPESSLPAVCPYPQQDSLLVLIAPIDLTHCLFIVLESHIITSCCLLSL